MDAVKNALDPLLVNGKLGRLSQTHTLPDTNRCPRMRGAGR